MKPLVVILALFLSGCVSHRLPNIKASEIKHTLAFPGVTSTVDASGISITDAYVVAADVSWRLTILGYTTITSAKDFRQKREKETTP